MDRNKHITLSFLGTGNYQPAKYNWHGKTCETRYFSYALNKFLEPDSSFVVLTNEAREKHAEELKEVLNFEEIPIPSGQSEEEVFEIFERITGSIPDNVKLSLDVTHGFRSQPIMVLAILIYLRSVKSVEVSGIYYGAYEAAGDSGVAPVFDLTPFLDIIDWTFAINRFRDKGDASELSAILAKIHKRTYMEQAPQPAMKLKSFGTNLDALMQSLSVIRPAETAGFASELTKMFPSVEKDLTNISQTRPLKLLFDDLKDETSNLKADKDDLFSDEGITMQAGMIRHYLKTGHYQQAVTLAREAMISLMVLELKGNPLDKEDRKKASDYLHDSRERNRIGDKNQIPSYHKQIMKTEHRLGDIRNDLNHAAMRAEPTSAAILIKNIREYCQDAIDLLENSD